MKLKKLCALPTSFEFALLYRLAIAYLFFGLTRLLFYLFNYEHFADMTTAQVLRAWGGGLRFDTAAVLYLNLLFILLSILPFRFRKHKY